MSLKGARFQEDFYVPEGSRFRNKLLQWKNLSENSGRIPEFHQ